MQSYAHCFLVMEADVANQLVQLLLRYGNHALRSQTVLLQSPNGGRGHLVFGLAGQHQRHEDLEAVHLGRLARRGQPLDTEAFK